MLTHVIVAPNEVGSAYDRAAILNGVLSHGHLNESELMALIGSADGIDDDYFRASVLDSVVTSQPLTSARVYKMRLNSANRISDNYYRAEVLKTIAALRAAPAVLP